ncbi:hypothetical protein R1T16_12675 [Flavobacterium sp. DG1-102-2]|uniref:hypothetical protein n=1 Tax=Flavobacterium sp. DG1-102-2 TaxID=3081663 RepID=UPI002949A2F2|nr:hypothetical protein [Flavobacterium sp. DG1-102-2]MDV6169282.1 hypothetical protein [Flavobacterium sp. DG1-102-2]
MKLLILFVSTLLFGTADLTGIRQQYLNAAKSAQVTQDLYDSLKDVSDSSSENTLVAYKAAALTLRAKHEKGMLTKKKLFTQGAKLLEAVIERDADNYEARLIRLSIQENAPKITGYNKKIAEDKTFIIRNYKAQKSDLKEYTQGFVKVSASITKEDKAAFN